MAPIPQPRAPETSPEAVYTTQDGRRIRIDPFWQCAAANFEMDWARLTAKLIRDELHKMHTPFNHRHSAFSAFAPLFLKHITDYAIKQQLQWKPVILNPFDAGTDPSRHDANLLTLLHPDQDFQPPQKAQDQIELTTFQLEQMFQTDMAMLRQDATEQVRGLIKEDAPFLIHSDIPAIRLFVEIAADVEDAGLVAMSQMVGRTPLCPDSVDEMALSGLKETTKSVCTQLSARLQLPRADLSPKAKPLYQGYLCVALKSISDAFNKMTQKDSNGHTALAGAILSGQGIVQTTPLAHIKSPRDEGPAASYCGELFVMMTTLTQRVAAGAADRDAERFAIKRAEKPIQAFFLNSEDSHAARQAAHQVLLEATALVGQSVDRLSGYQRKSPTLPHQQPSRFIQ